MTALPADIIRATRAARIVVATDSGVQASYPAARDGKTNPEPGYFESASDATTVLAQKVTLIGTRRRRFRVELQGEYWIDPLDGVPSFQLVDAEQGIDLPVMLCRMELDMENETTVLEVIG